MNTPGKSTPGKVFIYGTNESLPRDKLQAIHNVWNAMGTGGDQRTDSLGDIALTTVLAINQMAARSLNSGRKNTHWIHYKIRIGDVEIRYRFQLML